LYSVFTSHNVLLIDCDKPVPDLSRIKNGLLWKSMRCDGAAISDETELYFTGIEESELLLFDLA